MTRKNLASMPTSNDVKLPELIHIEDIYSTLDDFSQEVQKQLDVETTREDIKKRLINAATERGAEVKEDLIEKSIDIFLRNVYSFKEPSKGLSYRLAEGYVNRVKIAKIVGIPLISIGVIVGGADLASKGIKEAKLKLAEHRIENAVEGAYKKEHVLETEARTLSSESLEAQMQSELKILISQAETNLGSTRGFFTKFCTDGTASDDITRNNYLEADNQLAAINKSLGSAEESLSQGKQIVETQKNLVITRQSLDSLIQEIRSAKAPSPLTLRAESVYQSGVASLNNRQLSQGQSYRSDLLELKDNVQQFTILPAKADQLYQSIKIVAKEKEAVDQADKIYNEARTYINNVDIPPLKKAVANLEDLSMILNQEYELRIVSRPDVKSGIDRYYTDQNGRRSSGYYLIVEAVDSQGNVMPQLITNEETGTAKKVRMWGERVPVSAYERVKEDKIDDGIIQKNIVGEKSRGFLRIRIVYPGVGEREGQITEW